MSNQTCVCLSLILWHKVSLLRTPPSPPLERTPETLRQGSPHSSDQRGYSFPVAPLPPPPTAGQKRAV